MTRWLMRLLHRDDPPTLLADMRKLWPKAQTARVLYAKPDGRERMKPQSTLLRVFRRSA